MSALPSLLLIVWLLAPSAAISRVHFIHGQRLFQQRDYRRALEEFTTAAEAAPGELPDLWFDIGQCHRNLGHARLATLAFEHYLALAPDAADRAKVQAMIVQLGGHVAPESGAASPPSEPVPEAPAAASAAPTPPAPESAPAVATPSAATLTASLPAPAPSHRRRWLIWGGVAGGVVVGALAIGLGVGLSGGHAASPMLGSGGTFDTRGR